MIDRLTALLLALLTGCVADSQPDRMDHQEDHSIWHLTGWLSTEQHRVNEAIYLQLEDDPCDVENKYDRLVWEWVNQEGENAVARMNALAHSFEGERQAQAAVGRGFVHLAQKSYFSGDYVTASTHALNIYLSGTPHRVRLEALRIFCRTGDPVEINRQIEHIESARQDQRFQPILPELRRALEVRRLQSAPEDWP